MEKMLDFSFLFSVYQIIFNLYTDEFTSLLIFQSSIFVSQIKMSSTTCSVKACENTYHKSRGRLKFFKFPKNEVVKIEWIKACGLPFDTNVSNSEYRMMDA